jgi:hypothetical protein
MGKSIAEQEKDGAELMTRLIEAARKVDPEAAVMAEGRKLKLLTMRDTNTAMRLTYLIAKAMRDVSGHGARMLVMALHDVNEGAAESIYKGADRVACHAAKQIYDRMSPEDIARRQDELHEIIMASGNKPEIQVANRKT